MVNWLLSHGVSLALRYLPTNNPATNRNRFPNLDFNSPSNKKVNQPARNAQNSRRIMACHDFPSPPLLSIPFSPPSIPIPCLTTSRKIKVYPKHHKHKKQKAKNKKPRYFKKKKKKKSRTQKTQPRIYL